jgi:hypothetical protein
VGPKKVILHLAVKTTAARISTFISMPEKRASLKNVRIA